MTGRFSQQFIDDLLARIDIVDLIDARVPLKRSGSNYMACCPFHTEKTPSFSVNRAKQFFHCFGCGAHGDAINFVRTFERLDFAEAVLTLAESVGIRPPEDDVSSSALREENRIAHRLYELQSRIAQFYARQLRTHPEAPKAVDYLKRRGISGEIARRFRLGYAPPGWTNFPPEFDAADLRTAGLLVSKPSSSYDRFRDRIIYPIRDRRGRVVGFGGRVLDDSQPKYLNSPETPVFKKHQQVYGLFEALEARSKIERLLVVEGYMDVIALAQHGFPHAVATLGTATSADHIELLFRFADEIVFCFDGDEAGRKAAWKALQTVLPVLPEGRIVRFLALPQGEDPDSLIRREGADRFRARVAGAHLLSDFFFAELSRDVSLGSIEGRSLLIKRATPFLQSMNAGPFRQMMRAKLGELSHTAGPPGLTAARQRHRPKSANSLRPSARTRLLTMLVQHPHLASQIDETVRAFLLHDPGSGALLARLFALVEQYPNATAAEIKEFFRGTEEEPQFAELSTVECLAPSVGLAREFRDTVRLIERKALSQQLDDKEDALLRRSATSPLAGEDREELRQLQERRRRLNDQFPGDEG